MNTTQSKTAPVGRPFSNRLLTGEPFAKAPVVEVQDSRRPAGSSGATRVSHDLLSIRAAAEEEIERLGEPQIEEYTQQQGGNGAHPERGTPAVVRQQRSRRGPCSHKANRSQGQRSRWRFGAYSLVSATALGTAEPRPMAAARRYSQRSPCRGPSPTRGAPDHSGAPSW
jgi:hypothetical protein